MKTDSEFKLEPCPFCGAEVSMTAGRPVSGTFPARSYTFAHPAGDCVVRRSVVCVNLREAREWAAAWNRRANDK